MSLLVFNSLVNFFLTPLEKKFLKGYYDIQQIISDLSTDLIVARDVKTVLKTISVKLSSEVETDQSYFIFREMPDSRMALFKESENEPFHEFKDEDPIIEYFHEHNEPIAFGKIPVAVKESISQLPISEKSLWFPIKSINQLHGIFILGKKLTGDKYTETDYHMVKAVMNQLLVVFDRNHMHQQLVKEKDRNQSYIKQLEVVKKDKEQIDKDLERASKVQKRTLPQKSLLISDYNIETQFVPSDKVSGDYYSYFKFNENEYGFLIADAVGHGVTAALNSMIFKSILEKTLDGLRSPKEVLELLNQTIYINPSFTQYMPVIYGKLNTKTNTFTYANAGHHAGLAYINNQFKELESGGPPLGMSDDETFEEEILQLNDNDLTLLYSDGLEDGRNEKGEEFGRTGVEKVVRRYRDSAQEESFTTLMLDTWSKYKLEDGKQKDDMAYIFIEHVKEQFFSNS